MFLTWSLLWQPQHFMSIGCLSNTVAIVTFTRFLRKIIAKLIDKICYYASHINYPSLKDSQKMWFLTLFKCITQYRAKCCKVPFVSRGPIFYEVNLCVKLIDYPKCDIHPSNNLTDIRQNHRTTKYMSLAMYILWGQSLWSIIPNMSPVKRICVFEHSVMTNFNCACPAIQRGQGSGFLSEGSSWLNACMSEQQRFWRDSADAQARLNLRCSHRR